MEEIVMSENKSKKNNTLIVLLCIVLIAALALAVYAFIGKSGADKLTADLTAKIGAFEAQISDATAKLTESDAAAATRQTELDTAKTALEAAKNEAAAALEAAKGEAAAALQSLQAEFDTFKKTSEETLATALQDAEDYKVQAEAALNGAWAGSAQTFYEEGTAAAIRLYDVPGDTSYYVPESEIQTYINSLPAADLQQIITQKWILFAYDNAYEAWAEYRRTSYPRFTRYDGSFLGNNDIPARLTYPNAENTLNNEHYNEAVGRQGADHAYTKVWWDVF